MATLILLLVVSLQAFGQERSADKVTMPLTGVVYDENGAVIVQALVVAYGPDSQKYEATTSDEGIYELRLPLGIYKIEAGARHFCLNRVKPFRVVKSRYRKISLDFVLMVFDSKCEDGSPIERKQTRPDGKKHPIEIIE